MTPNTNIHDVSPARLTRRRFMSRALVATTTWGGAPWRTVAGAAVATAAEIAAAIVDTHVYVGHWPHAMLANEAPHELAARLVSNNVTQAWAGSFEGLFHKDIAAVNARLAEACAQIGSGVLVPFGTVNPMLPDWQDDVRRCRETHRMPGIRLHPSYHGYSLADPRFAELLALAARNGLIVQIIVWLDDAQHRWLTPPLADVAPPPVLAVNRKQLGVGRSPAPRARLLISGVRVEDAKAWREAFETADTYFDVSRFQSHNQLAWREFIRSSERVVIGSGTPLHSHKSAQLLLACADIPNDRRHAVARGVACRLVDAR